MKNFNKILKSIRANGNVLLGILLVSASLLMMNYYTIKILNGVRSYINGESYYSKGQKDASRDLQMYLDTGEKRFWRSFKNNIQVNIGDKIARINLLSKNTEKAKEGFLLGKNHSGDIDDMIWLFTTFKDFSFMQIPITSWTGGDAVVEQQLQLGKLINEKVTAGKINEEDKLAIKHKIHELSTDLTNFEKQFIGSLGATARSVSKLLLIANTCLIIVIVGGAGLFALRTIKKLIRSEEILLQNNEKLLQTNNELDRFVYSASHDLRAPITSLKGLINVASIESNKQKLADYFKMMNESLDKQDTFIRKIISFSKNKRSESTIEEFDLDFLLDSILDHFKFMDNYGIIEVRKFINVEEINADIVRLEIILSNLLSNAIKYSDPNKEKPFIEIVANLVEDKLNINVSDNGIGISESSINRIFEMFYMTQNNESGSGVGLYIVKETVDKLGGEILVESEKNIGSKFNLTIPVNVSNN